MGDLAPTPSVLSTDVRGTGPRLVLVHGFTQTNRCWGPLPAELTDDHELMLVDAPGHGGSAGVAASIEDGARLLVEAGGPGTYVGYSMGGRLALRAALDHPVVVERLVLIGASPGIADDAGRAARRAADEALADRLEIIGVDAFLDEWLDQPLFATLPPMMRCLAERRRNSADGLASSLRLAGTGAMEPLWDRLPELKVPVLLVVGEHDAKFTAIANQMVARLGGPAIVAVLPNAGHTAHLEKPVSFLGAIRDWLEDQAET